MIGKLFCGKIKTLLNYLVLNKHYSITMIKSASNVFRKKVNFDLKQVLQLINISYDQNKSKQQNRQKLITFYIKECQNISYYSMKDCLKTLSLQTNFRIIQIYLEQFSNLKYFGQVQQQSIHYFFLYWGKIIIKVASQCYKQLDRKFYYNYIKNFSKYQYLTKRNKQISLLYLTLVFKFQIHFKSIISKQLISFIRTAYDDVLDEKFQHQQITNLLFMSSKFGLDNLYYQKSDEIYKQLLAKFSDKWYQKKYSHTLSISFAKIGVKNEQIKIGLLQLTKSNKPDQLLFSLSALLQLRYITSQNLTKSIVQLFKKVIKIYKFQFKILNKYLTSFLYRAGIWIEQFWLKYFSEIQKYSITEIINLNFQIDLYTLRTLFQIDKDIISPKIIQQGNQFFGKLLSKGYSIDKFQIIKTYENRFHYNNQAKKQIQILLAHSIRTVQAVQIKIQAPVGPFCVDILINDKYIIEVNNKHHYIRDLDLNNQNLSLKSFFRRRLLMKMGYKILFVPVEQFNQPTFEFIEKVSKFFNSL